MSLLYRLGRWGALAATSVLVGASPSPTWAVTQGSRPDGLEAAAIRLSIARDGDDLLDFCTSNSDKCAISVYDISTGREGHLFPDRPQALASTSKILFLLGYAQAVADGDLDPDDTIGRDEWARYLTLDGFALEASWEDLGQPGNPTWGELLRMMILHSDNATPDHLSARLGKKGVSKARKRFKGFHDTPLPISSMFGIWFNGDGVGGTGSRVADAYGSIATPGYRREAQSLFDSLANADPLATYRESLCVQPPWESGGACDPPTPSPTLAERRFLFRNHFTRSTTRAYMKIMAGLLQGTILDSEVRDIIEPLLEIWLDEFPTLSPSFSRFGLKGGSLDTGEGLDILTWAHYMRTGSGSDYVVVVFLQALSEATNPPGGADVNAFAQQFALTPAFRERVLAALEDDDERPELVPQITSVKARGGDRGAVNLTIKARVESAGPHTVRGVTVRLYLSDDNVLDADDELIDEATVAKIKGTTGTNLKLRGSTSGSTADRYVILVVDPEGDIDQQDETNDMIWERLQ